MIACVGVVWGALCLTFFKSPVATFMIAISLIIAVVAYPHSLTHPPLQPLAISPAALIPHTSSQSTTQEAASYLQPVSHNSQQQDWQTTNEPAQHKVEPQHTDNLPTSFHMEESETKCIFYSRHPFVLTLLVSLSPTSTPIFSLIIFFAPPFDMTPLDKEPKSLPLQSIPILFSFLYLIFLFSLLLLSSFSYFRIIYLLSLNSQLDKEPEPISRDDIILGPGVEVARGSKPTITLSGGGMVSKNTNPFSFLSSEIYIYIYILLCYSFFDNSRYVKERHQKYPFYFP